ncbi:MAG: DNA-processing protein DprA [Bacteroidota bacterium]
MQDEQLKYRIGLSLIDGVGDVVAKRLIAYCGGVEAVFKEKKGNLLKIPLVGSGIANAILAQTVLSRAEQEIAYIQKNNIHPLFYLDDDYPNRLKYCDDSPIMLYCKGKMDLNAQKIVSIVGTRNASDYGKKMCTKLVEDLVTHNVLIVSGLAYGIDICAHKAAIKNNLQTVAVVAHGHDRIYPSLHKSVAEKMQGKGGVVTDFLSQTNPDRENFPKRNRIIAGLPDALIVIESARRGGALITAEIANSYNRDVFAVPGRLNDTYSEGCNWLIKINKAALIESVKDLEYLMGWENKKSKKHAVQKKMFVDLKPEEKVLIDILKEDGSLGIDTICLKSQMSTSKVASMLLTLEFSGVVKCLPGKVYQLG